MFLHLISLTFHTWINIYKETFCCLVTSMFKHLLWLITFSIFFFFLRSATKTKRQINSFSSANSVKPKAKSCSFNSCCNGWLWVHGVCCGCCRIPSVHRRLQSQQRQTCPEERKKERKKEASEKHVWSSQTALLSSLFHCTFLNNTSPHLPTPTDN